MISSRLTRIICILGAAIGACAGWADDPFEWRTDFLPKLPVAMMNHAVGTHNGALLVAGGRSIGVSLEDSIPLDTLYALEPGATAWRLVGKLPSTLMAAACASDASGFYLVGGFDGKQNAKDILRLDFHDGQLGVFRLPSALPAGVSSANAAIYGGRLYFGGGISTANSELVANSILYSIDLANPGAGWSQNNRIPGVERLGSIIASGTDGVYVVGGRPWGVGLGKTATVSSVDDAYCYSPGNGWSSLPMPPYDFRRVPAFAFGPSHLLLLGTGDSGEAQNDVLGYERITNTWTKLGELPDTRENTNAVFWNGMVVVPGGSHLTSARSMTVEDSVLSGTTRVRANGFGWLDYVVIGIYLLAMLGMGLYFSKKDDSTDNFFLGGRAVPWWAAGLSIFGTSISSITYLAIPAKAYATDWVFMVGSMTILLIAPLIVWYYIPAFRRAPITTAYEYLETRFNLATRIYGSIVFVLFQVGRIAIVLYLPALVLSASTGLSMEFSIIAMGIITTIYTVMGGVEAVIWTDVVQSFVLVGGALLSLYIAISSIDGGFGALSAMAAAEGKTHWFTFSTDYTTTAIWVCVIGNAFAMFYPSTADQTIVQRYLTTATEKAAARAVWTNALLTVPVSFLFFGLGTALWGYFKTHPGQLDPTLPTDAILPVFVMETFPVGLRSTLIAGVFAAAMSSLSASMNSLAAVAINDYYRRFVPDLPEDRALRAAKIVTLLVGVFGTVMALIIAWLNVPSLFDQWLRWLGLIGGGLAGIMALGVFTTRGHGRGAIAGALASTAAVIWAQSTPMHFFLHGMVGFVSAFVVGYVASWIIPRAK